MGMLRKPTEQGQRFRGFRGQNLVEFGLTLPFIVVMIIFITEVGRVWFYYEALKMAAMDGAHTAAAYHNETVGSQAVQKKLASAGITPTNISVSQANNQHAYQVTVSGNFLPMFGAVTLPFINVTMFDGFPISYTALKEEAVY